MWASSVRRRATAFVSAVARDLPQLRVRGHGHTVVHTISLLFPPAPPQPQDVDLLARLETAQRAAKAGRLAQWRYGDVGESDDEKR